MSSPTVTCSAVGPVVCGAVVFRRRGELRVAVAVKATFSLTPGGPAALAPPRDLVREPRAFDRDPAQSVECASDLVPLRARADVTFIGHAYPPPGRPSAAISVRLAVVGATTLVDKALHVFGDRPTGAAPMPFVRMPLRYERGPGGGRPHPNVVDVVDPARRAGFGPLRLPLAGDAVADLTDEEDGASFQAAPADQRAPFLRGDEWVVLDGLHPVHARLQTQLPRARGVARVDVAGHVTDLSLVADTLAIDGDAELMVVVWRGSVPAGPGDAVRVLGGVEVGGRRLAWPDEAEAKRASARLASTTGPADAEQIARAVRRAVPFSPATGVPSVAEPSAPSAPRAKAPSSISGTISLDRAAEFAAIARAATPFAGPPPSAAAVVPPPGLVPAQAHGPADVPAPPSEAPRAPPPGRPTPIDAPAEPQGPHVATPTRTTPAVPVFHATPFAIVTFPCQFAPPTPARALVVKGTFDLVADGPARARDEADPLHGDDDGRTTDFAIWKPRADVLLTGSAHGGGRAVSEVVFSFGRAPNAFERRAAVFGDRTWAQRLTRAEATAPEPFDSVPLVAARAFGGPRFEDNPVGVGHAARAGAPLPNIEDASCLVLSPRDEPAPMTFGPVPAAWRARASKLGTYDPTWLATRWPYFPADFDFAFFQAAPAAQQLRHLVGDEPFAIRGVGDGAAIAGSLPGLRVRAIAEKRSGELLDVAMALDTAAFDGDARTLKLVWRAVIDVADDEASDVAALYFAAEPLAAAPARAASIRAACLAPPLAARAAPETPAEAPAPPPDPDTERVLADARARVAAGRERLAAAGIAFDLDPKMDLGAPPPPLPRLDGPAFAEKMRAAGAPAEEVARVVKLVDAANDVAADADRPPPAPSDVRARVVAMLAAGASFDGLDLAGADLSELDFSGRSLAHARLGGARLDGCKLVDAGLRGAQLGGASMRDVDATRADFEGADLRRATLTNARLEGAKLGRANLDEAACAGAVIDAATGGRASFVGADLTGARLDRASLDRPDFTRATLVDASFADAVLVKPTLFDVAGARARFDRAKLAGARADASSFAGASFAAADASNSAWEGATLDDASFRGAQLAGVGLVRASCAGADFSAAELTDARLSRGVFTRAVFVGANLLRAKLDHADATGADLRRANLYAAETWDAKLGGAHLDGAILAKSKLAPRRSR